MASYDNGSNAFLACLTAIVAYFVYHVVHNAFFHPLSKFPGPPIAGLTRYWKAYIECIAQQSFCHYLAELHAQYGETLC